MLPVCSSLPASETWRSTVHDYNPPRFTPAVGAKGSSDVLMETVVDQTAPVGQKGSQFKVCVHVCVVAC